MCVVGKTGECIPIFEGDDDCEIKCAICGEGTTSAEIHYSASVAKRVRPAQKNIFVVDIARPLERKEKYLRHLADANGRARSGNGDDCEKNQNA